VIRSTYLIFLELLGGIFAGVWIAAFIAALYFLYESLANQEPWSSLLWSIGVSVICRQIAVVLTNHRRRIHYMDQLIERGYSHRDALAAWRTATNGGLNLLRNLQQAEAVKHLYTAIDTPSAETNIV